MSKSSMDGDGNAAGWFCELMKDLAASYPNFKASERQTRVYAAALADLTPQQVKTAMGRAILDLRFFPSIAELRAFVDTPTDDRAQRAWLQVRDAVEKAGAWRSVIIDDPWTAEALRRVAGSWADFCAVAEGPDLHVVRQGFLSSYRDARRTVPRHGASTKFAGLCETTGTAILDTVVARLTEAGDVIVNDPARALPSGPPRHQLPSGGEM